MYSKSVDGDDQLIMSYTPADISTSSKAEACYPAGLRLFPNGCVYFPLWRAMISSASLCVMLPSRTCFSQNGLTAARSASSVSYGPNGETDTIGGQKFTWTQEEIDKTIAGLLCSAIISDTLLFRSPTCTPMDRAAAVSLAEMAGIKLDEFANQMFEAGSELKGKSDAEILYLDFKKFSAGKTNFGVGQINSLNAEELGKLKNRMLPFMEKAREDEGLDMIFFMLTNILTETTELLCVGQGAAQVVADAFHVGDANEELKQTATLPGVVSRKKQLIPALTVTLEQ